VVAAGDPAPDFELPDQDGEPVRLAHVIPKVSPKAHDEQVLGVLAEL
jgi:hypothetical protein